METGGRHKELSPVFFILTSSISILSTFYQLSSFANIGKVCRKNRLFFVADSFAPRSLITYPPREKNALKTKKIKNLFGSYTGNLYLCSRNKDTNNNLKYTADTDTGTANTAAY